MTSARMTITTEERALIAAVRSLRVAWAIRQSLHDTGRDTCTAEVQRALQAAGTGMWTRR